MGFRTARTFPTISWVCRYPVDGRIIACMTQSSIRDAKATDATTRDRELARRLVLAGAVWALIWTVILAFLFVFGEDLSAFVV